MFRIGKSEEFEKLQDRSLYLLLLIAQTLDTTGFSADDVASFVTSELGYRECLSWLQNNNYLTRLQVGMTNYSFTEKAELFLRRVEA